MAKSSCMVHALIQTGISRAPDGVGVEREISQSGSAIESCPGGSAAIRGEANAMSCWKGGKADQSASDAASGPCVNDEECQVCLLLSFALSALCSVG